MVLMRTYSAAACTLIQKVNLSTDAGSRSKGRNDVWEGRNQVRSGSPNERETARLKKSRFCGEVIDPSRTPFVAFQLVNRQKDTAFKAVALKVGGLASMLVVPPCLWFLHAFVDYFSYSTSSFPIAPLITSL